MIQKLKNNLGKLLTLTVILSVSLTMGVNAQSTGELKDDISEKQTQLDELNDRISGLQKEISAKQKQVSSLNNEIALYDLQILQLETQIKALEVEIEKLGDEISKTEVEIQQTEEEIEKQKEFLAEALRLIHEFDGITALEMTLGNDTFSEFLDQVEYAGNLQERTQEVLQQVKDLKLELEQKKVDLQQQIEDQRAAQEQLKISRSNVATQKNDKQILLSRTRGQEAVYQQLLSDVAAEQEQVAREIFELEVELRNQLGDTTLPSIPGYLQWPASGILTQGYGNTGFTSLGYNFHNGIDIAGPPGTKIRAAGDGVVFDMGTGQTAYGNWIVIKHTLVRDGTANNIYTLYAHLQGFNVSTGQAVKGGDLIGYMGNTGNTTRLLYGPERGYHLHFTVFDEKGFNIKPGAYQDVYGPYRIPVGITYNPFNFLQ